jgi:Cu2+-exporting ATPase
MGARWRWYHRATLKEKNIALPTEGSTGAAETVVHVLVDGKLAGSIALADAIRESSAAAIKQFREQGIKTYMATGDNKQVGKAVSDALGLDGFYAEVLAARESGADQGTAGEG